MWVDLTRGFPVNNWTGHHDYSHLSANYDEGVVQELCSISWLFDHFMVIMIAMGSITQVLILSLCDVIQIGLLSWFCKGIRSAKHLFIPSTDSLHKYKHYVLRCKYFYSSTVDPGVSQDIFNHEKFLKQTSYTCLSLEICSILHSEMINILRCFF